MKRFLSVGVLAALLSTVACSTPNGSASFGSLVPESPGRTARDTLGGSPPMRFNMDLYDAARWGTGSHVNLALRAVYLVSGRTTRLLAGFERNRVIDLLSLKHAPLKLAGSLPAGHYDALRLLVDPSRSNVIVAGRSYPMVVHAPASPFEQGAVQIDAPLVFTASSGDLLRVAVDFNVLESIALHDGVADVTPRLVVAHEPSQVRGRLVNAAGAPVVGATVAAYAGDALVNTTLSEADGTFVLHALSAGSYHITVLNRYVTESGEQVASTGSSHTSGPAIDVVVTAAALLDVGTLND